MANEQDNTEKPPNCCKSVLAENIGQWMDTVSNKDLWERKTKFKWRYKLLREGGDGLATH